jgi:hypothetical protein
MKTYYFNTTKDSPDNIVLFYMTKDNALVTRSAIRKQFGDVSPFKIPHLHSRVKVKKSILFSTGNKLALMYQIKREIMRYKNV